MSIEEVSNDLLRVTHLLEDLYKGIQRRRNAVESVCSDCRQLMQPWPRSFNPLPVLNKKKPEQTVKNSDANLKTEIIELKEAAVADVALTKAGHVRQRYRNKVCNASSDIGPSHLEFRKQQDYIYTESDATSERSFSSEKPFDEVAARTLSTDNFVEAENSFKNSDTKASSVASVPIPNVLPNTYESRTSPKMINQSNLNQGDRVKTNGHVLNVYEEFSESAVIDKSSLDQILSYSQMNSLNKPSNSNKAQVNSLNKLYNSNRTQSNSTNKSNNRMPSNSSDKSSITNCKQIGLLGNSSNINKTQSFSAKSLSNIGRTSNVKNTAKPLQTSVIKNATKLQQTPKAYVPAHVTAPFKTVPHLQPSRRTVKSSTKQQPSEAVVRPCNAISNRSAGSQKSIESNKSVESNHAKSVISGDFSSIHESTSRNSTLRRAQNSADPRLTATRFDMCEGTGQENSVTYNTESIGLENLLSSVHVATKDKEYAESGSLSSQSLTATYSDNDAVEGKGVCRSQPDNLDQGILDHNLGVDEIVDECAEIGEIKDGRFVLSQHGSRLKLPPNLRRCEAANERLRQDIIQSLIASTTISNKQQHRATGGCADRKKSSDKFMKLLQTRNESGACGEMAKIKSISDLCHWLTCLLDRVECLNISERSSWQEVLTARTCVEFVLKEFGVLRQAAERCDDFDMSVPNSLHESIKSKLMQELSAEEKNVCGKTLYYRSLGQISKYWSLAFRVEQLRIRNHVIHHVAPKVLKLLHCLNPNDRLYNQACRLLYSFVTASGQSFPVILRDEE